MPRELGRGGEGGWNPGLFFPAKEKDKRAGGGSARARKFILVDLPLFDLPVATADVLFQIQLSGLTPILAHPERNRYLVRHPAIVMEMVGRGIELQVNSGSLEGIYGRPAKQSAVSLIKEGAARLIASDAHQPTGRGPDLTKAAAIIERQFGPDATRIMLQENPDRVINGETLQAAVNGGVKSSRKRFFSNLFLGDGNWIIG